jgi:hypothetical protein
MPPSQPIVNNKISGSAHAGTLAGGTVATTTTAAQTSSGPVRILVRVICIRFDAWCVRYLPQRLYVPAQESTRARAAADAPARAQFPATASPVAPGLTPTVSVTRAPAQGTTGRILLRR